MTRPSKMTRLLFDVIEDRLGAVGSGDRTPLLDDITEDYRKAAGIRTKEASNLMERRLDTVLRMFEDDDWTPVKVTSHFVSKYKGQAEDHPTTDKEIVRSVAGGGSGLPTYAIHFCSDTDCILFMEARIRGLESGEKKVRHQVRRMNGAAESGNLTTDAVETVVLQSGIGPRKDIRRVHRIADRHAQQRLQLPAS